MSAEATAAEAASPVFQIYLLVNRITMRMYVGATSRCVCVRFREHLCGVSRLEHRYTKRRGYVAMRADGIQDLVAVHYASALDVCDAFDVEQDIIKEFDLLNPSFGYNSGNTEMPSSGAAKHKYRCVCDKMRQRGRLAATLEEAWS